MVRLGRPVGATATGVLCAFLLALSPASAIAAAPRLLGLPNLLPPIGTADSYTTPYETELVVDAPGVLANDVDLDSPVLTTKLVSGPANGSLILEPDGHFHYQPDPGFDGLDTFTYLPFDGTYQALLPVTVSIRVAGPVPTPTPQPTPTPTPTQTPKPKPTPSPSIPIPAVTVPPLPIPQPTVPPVPIPAPTLRPLPTPTPQPTPIATPAPTPTASSAVASGSPVQTPGPSTAPGSTSGPSAAPDPTPATSTQPGVIAVTGGRGPSGGPDVPPTLPLLEPLAGTVSLGAFGDFGLGIEWIVPTAIFTVPGFLLILIGLAQVFGGFVWLPLARRSLRGDGRRADARANRIRPDERSRPAVPQ